MVDYVGLKKGPYDYLVGKRIEITPSQTIAVCDQRCYCGMNRGDACVENIDCTRFEVPPFQTCIRLVSGGTTPVGFDWSRQQVFNISWATEAPTGWTRCATENGVCAVTGTRLVRYGADWWWATKTVTGSTPCTNAVFGDPAPGFMKTCEVQREPDQRWLSGFADRRRELSVGQPAKADFRRTAVGR
jgi:hypothetical protein